MEEKDSKSDEEIENNNLSNNIQTHSNDLLDEIVENEDVILFDEYQLNDISSSNGYAYAVLIDAGS